MVMSVQIMFNRINSKNCFKVVRWAKGCFGHVLACPSPFGNHRNMRDTKTQLVFCTVLHLSVQPSLSHESFEVKSIFLKPCLKSCFFFTLQSSLLNLSDLLFSRCNVVSSPHSPSTLDYLLHSRTARSPCTGSHAADICVQAGPSDVDFTTPHWELSWSPYNPLNRSGPPQLLCVSMCFETFIVCVFKPCPDQLRSSMQVVHVHSRRHGMQIASFSV